MEGLGFGRLALGVGTLVDQADLEALVEEGEFSEPLAHGLVGELDRVGEDVGVGPERRMVEPVFLAALPFLSGPVGLPFS